MWFLIIFLLGIIIFLLYYLFKNGYFEQEKRKSRELEHELHIQQLQADFNQKLQKLRSDLQEKERLFNKELSDKREKLILYFKELEREQNEELKEYRLKQSLAIAAELDKLKKDSKEKVNEEIKKEIREMLDNKTKVLLNIEKEYSTSYEVINQKLNDLRSLEQAAIAARVRAYEEENKDEFYKVNISSQDIEEVKELESIIPKLRNALPLRQAIYNIYYRDAVKDLTNRVCGTERKTGIYKITYIPTGQCYIGQSVDIANRWQQHCKRGAGAEHPTGSKLYPEMLKHGIYNFKFEIIEEVEDNKLSEREKYWGEYFGAKVFGYSIKN